jgi:hypothetical protein
MVYIVVVHPQLSHNLFSMVVHWWMLGHIILDDVELNVSTPTPFSIRVDATLAKLLVL